MHAVESAVVLAIAIGVVAHTISVMPVAAPLRNWVASRLDGAASRGDNKKHALARWNRADKLVRCPFCLAHWLSAFAVLFYRPWIVHGGGPLDWAVTWLAITGASMFCVLIIKKALSPMGTF